MAQKKVWFGTPDRMAWVPAPTINMPRGTVGWSVTNKRISGTAGVRRSFTAHREYEMEWRTKHAADLSHILAVLNGDYGFAGIHWCDPFAMPTNMFPDMWASPWKTAYDGRNLAGQESLTERAEASATPDNSYGYPTQSATYGLYGTEVTRALWLPIPPGYTMHLGIHGEASGTARMTYSVGGTGFYPGDDVYPDDDLYPGSFGSGDNDFTLLPVTTDTRYNVSVNGDDTNGVIIRLAGAGDITLSGMLAVLLPTGIPPTDGGWSPGQGHERLSKDGDAALTGFSAALDRSTFSTRLIEIA